MPDPRFIFRKPGSFMHPVLSCILSVVAMSTIPGIKMCILLGKLNDTLKFGPSSVWTDCCLTIMCILYFHLGSVKLLFAIYVGE